MEDKIVREKLTTMIDKDLKKDLKVLSAETEENLNIYLEEGIRYILKKYKGEDK